MRNAEGPLGCISGADADSATAFSGLDHTQEINHAQRFERVIIAMKRRLDKPMTNSDMADIACLSPCHFNRLFRLATGIPPIQFHYAVRLERAKRLLMDTDLPITEICFDVGYNSLGTFTSRFNRLVGLSPRAFRALSRKFAAIKLSDLAVVLHEAIDASARLDVRARETDQLVFRALFPRAIPEGIPAACTLTSDPGPCHMPDPGHGIWHIFAVAVPWNASGLQLLTLDGLRRGRSGPIRADGNGCAGASRIQLAPPGILDPPILMALPVLISRILAGRASPPSRRSPAGARDCPPVMILSG